MASQPDSTILWCLEQLASENLEAEILVGLIKHFTETRGPEVLEQPLKVRLVLAGFTGATEITNETLEDLQKIAALLNQTQDVILLEKKEELLPPPGLMTQVKTELVAQGWRNSIKVTARELITLMRKTFGQQPEAHEKKRYDELQKAVTMPTFRAHIDRQLDYDNALNGLIRYALDAQAAMGPTVLQVINDDINSGNYFPGQALPEPAPAVPAPLPEPSPTCPPAASPRRNAPLTTAQVVNNPLLEQVLDQLRSAGGEDPKQQAFAQAQMLLAAQALKDIIPDGNNNAAAPAQMHNRRKNKKWSEEEVQRLIDACRKHGPGAWALIQSENSDIWGLIPGTNSGEHFRSQVDLKDKWRNLAGHKGDTAHRNNPEAMLVDQMWQAKRQREVASPAEGLRAIGPAGVGVLQATGNLNTTTTEVKGKKLNTRRKGKTQETGSQEQEEEEEEDAVDEEDAAETTEVQEQGEGEEELEANDIDAETAPPAKKAKRNSGSGRKIVKKPAPKKMGKTRSKK